MEITITWQELLIAVVLATGVYLLETVLFARRRRRTASGGHEQDGEIHKLRAEVVTLQHRLDTLEVRLGVAEPAQEEGSHAAYDYAIQYARQGMIAPEIAARCGISCDEAALIVAMHRKGQEGS